MSPSPRVTVAIVAALLCAASSVTAQRVSPTLGRPIAWQVFHSGGPPTVTGTVVNLLGHPEANVPISVPTAGLRTVTDSNGRFELVLPGSGDWTVHVGFGSTARTAELTIPSASRVVLAAVLSDGPALCQNICMGTPCEDLQVLVVDSVSNRSPRATATIRLIHPLGTTVHRVSLGGGAEATLAFAGIGRRVETTGYHSIEVSVPGYRLWRKDRVWLEQVPACHGVLLGREHVARLVPSH